MCSARRSWVLFITLVTKSHDPLIAPEAQVEAFIVTLIDPVKECFKGTLVILNVRV